MRSISLFFRSVAKLLIIFAALTVSPASLYAQDAKEGASIFKSKCTSCHALDKKMIGPALKGVTERHSEEWLIKWIQNSQKMIAAGDPEAVKIYNEYKPQVMTAFAELTPENIKSVLAYIKEGPVGPAAGVPGTGLPGDTGTTESSDVSDFMLIGLIAVIVIAFLVILVLNRVIKTLERMMLKKQGLLVEEEVAVVSTDKFAGLKKLAKNKKFIFFVIILTVIFLGSVSWMGMWNTGVHTGYQPVQPIKFSHQLHAGINKIDCQYCHSGAYKSKNASIPSLNVCMNCHNYVTASDKYGGETSPEIQKIYTALDYNSTTRQYGNNQKAVQWIRIHNLPDFAYFNHSQHVSVAGVACQKCHGPVQTMEELYQYSPLTMKWCINCHKETEVNHKDNKYYDRLIAAHEQLKQGGKITAAVAGGLECGKCHY